MILAPSVAGELVELVGANSCFLFDSFSFFFSAALVMTLTIERPAAAPAAAPGAGGLAAVHRSMVEGFRFIFTHPTLSFVIVSMTSGMFAMRCFGALLSVYVRDILSSTSAAFGVLNTVIGVGMIISTQFLTRIGRKVPPQNLVVYGLGGMGIAVLVTAVFGAMASTAVGMLMMGGSAAAIFIPAQTLLQHETPQEMLGRVMSSLMSLVAGAQVAAMLVAAPVAQFAGIRTLYFASAGMLLLISLVGHWKVPETAATAQAGQ